MTVSLKLAKQALTYLGNSNSAVKANSKKYAEILQTVVAGKSKGEKKAFYKLYEQFLGNPENKRIRTQVEDTIRHCRTVEQSAELGGEIFSELNRHTAAFALENKLVRPVAVRNIFTSSVKELNKKSRAISDDISASLIKSIELTPEQISEIANSAIKDTAKTGAVLTGRLIMYPINKTISMLFPKRFRETCKGLMNLSRNDFGTAYYNNLVKSKELLGRAPSTIKVSSSSARLTFQELIGKKQKYNCQGGFNMFDNTIMYTKEFPLLPKWLQTNLITHELQHFKQADDIIRTFGIERYMDALKAYTLKTMRASKQYANKTDSELRHILNNDWKEKGVAEAIRKAFAGSVEAEKINPLSTQGQQAKVYLEALENYKGLGGGFIADVSKEYLNNPMEKEAYKVGAKSGLMALVLQNLNLQTI